MTYKPNYTITDRMLKAVSRIEVLNELILKAQILPLWEKKLRHQARIKSTHYSTRIEGNRLTLAQVEKISQSKSITGAPSRDVREVQNYFKVLDFVEEMGKQKLVFSNELILRIHYLTMDGILAGGLKGKYRIQQNVVKDGSTGLIVYMPPPFEEVSQLINSLLEFLNSQDNIHPVLKAGISHYEFVRIHPFMDGNGRVARALAMLVLYANGYDVRKLFALEEYYENDRQRYYESIESVEKSNGNLTGWLEYFSEGMTFELERIQNGIDELSLKGKGGVPSDLSPRQISAVSFIRKIGTISNSGYRKRFHVSNKTAQTDLQKLVDKGFLKIEGKGRSLRYLYKTSLYEKQA